MYPLYTYGEKAHRPLVKSTSISDLQQNPAEECDRKVPMEDPKQIEDDIWGRDH